jgi:uncharacterized protein (TIGR01777 family)
MTVIAVTGSSGFVGSALLPALRARGCEVRRFVRGAADAPDAIAWDPASGRVDADRCRGVDAVIHLAGENVAGGRWTAARRRRIDESRGPATQRLCRELAKVLPPPRALLSASAIGYYGDRGDEPLDERSGSGQGFLADVVRAWEAGTAPLAAAGARVVHLRIGIVLDPGGGALGRMLLPFRLGLGGRLGHGRQVMSWISRRDLVAAILFLLDSAAAQGPFNCTAPAPVTNREFTRALGKALRRPAVLPVPAFALRLLFGGFADEALLAGARVLPRRLQELGFAFAHDTLDQALAGARR